MSNDLIADNTGLVYCKDAFVGSCLISANNGELFMITAGHVFYGKDFKAKVNLKDWTVIDNKNIAHTVLEVVGDVNFAKKHDIVWVKLICHSNLNGFKPIRFCTVPRNPVYSFLFRGKYEYAKDLVTHTNITYASKSANPSWFNCNIDRAKLTNSDYKSGSDWLGGWSGSGLVIANHDDLICFGVMVEIPENGNTSQLTFASISILKETGFQPEIEDSQMFDLDKVFNAKSLNEIIRTVDEKVIDEWQANTKNNLPLNLINTKLTKLYPPKTFEENRRRIIKGIVAGKSYVSTILGRHEQLKELYENARNVYDLKDKTFYVSDRSQARKQLNELQKEYDQFMGAQLHEKLAPAEIKILGVYDVYDWISKCSLDFLIDD
jgi:hypothetical protein